jgi:hypothetical protein
VETFFGLTAEYKRFLLEELFQLQFTGKMSLGDAQRLPTYQRKWFIERTQKEIDAMNKAIKEAQTKKGR